MNLLNKKNIALAISLGVVSYLLTMAQVYYRIEFTGIITDSREVFILIGAALTGPIGGVLVALLSTIQEPSSNIQLYFIFKHLFCAFLFGFAYKKYIYEKYSMPIFLIAWVIFVLIYYVIFFWPGFLSIYFLFPTVYISLINNPNPTSAFMEVFTAWLYEFIFTAFVSSILLIAIPSNFRKPMWGNSQSPAEYKSRILEKLKINPKIFQNTLAIRLTIWFVLFSLAAVFILSIYLKNDVTEIILNRETVFLQREAINIVSKGSLTEVKENILSEKTTPFYQAGSYVIVNLEGEIIFIHNHLPNINNVLSDVTDETIKKIITIKEGYLIDKLKMVCLGFSHSRSNANNFIVVVISNKETLEKYVAELLSATNRKLGWIAFFMSLGLSLVLLFVIKRPLTKMTKLISEFGAGNFSVRVPVEEMNDEIKLLAKSFNKMADNINEANIYLEKEIENHKRTSAYLSESEERFRLLAENSTDMISRHDLNGVYLYVSPACQTLLGFQPNELVGHSAFEFIHPEDISNIEESRIKVIDLSVASTNIYRVKNRDGNYIWLETISRSITDKETGKIYEIQSSSRDITDRKRAEDDLVKSEQKARAYFDQSYSFVGLLNPDGILIEANKTALEFANVDLSEILGKPFWDTPWWSHSHEMQNRIKSAIKSASEGKVIRAEATHPSIDGSLRIIDFTLKPIKDELGHVLFLMPEGRDVTESKQAEEALKRSEERFRLILENMPILLNAFDEFGNIIVWNKACEISTGYSAQEMIGNPNAMALLYPDENYRLKVWNSSSDPNSTDNIYDLVKKNGEIRTIEWFDIYHYLDIPGWDSWGIGQDITERLIAETSLRKNEAMLSNILNSIPQSVFWKNKESVYLGSNKLFAEQAGIADPKLLIGKLDSDLPWKQEDIASYLADDKFVMESKKPKLHIIETLQQANGEQLWIDTTKIPLIDSKGEVYGVLGVYEDITEKKKTEDALLENQRILSNLMNNMPGMAYRYKNDSAWTMEFVSEGCYDLTGYKPADLIESKVISYNEIIHHEDREQVWNSVQSAIQMRESFRFEYRITAANGTEKWVWEQGLGIYSSSGELISLEGFIIDITERKWAEKEINKLHARFESIFHSSPLAITITRVNDGLFVDVNQMFTEQTGYTREEVVGKKSSDLKFWTNWDARMEAASQILEYGFIKNYETIIKRKDNSLYDVSFNASLINIMDVPHIIGIFEDISDRKRLEEALKNVVIASGLNSHENIFATLAIQLSKAMKVKYALIGRLKNNNSGLMQTLAVSADGVNMDNFEYELKGTPCQNVINQGVCSFPKNAASLFPEDLLLASMGVEGYMGMPLTDSKGFVTGIIVILHDKELVQLPEAKSILSLFGYRASSELERMQREEELNLYKDHLIDMVEDRTSELKQSRETFRTLAENTKDAIFRIDIVSQVYYLNFSSRKIFGINVNEYFGKPIAELGMGNETLKMFGTEINKVIENAQNQHVEFQLPDKSWLSILTMPEFDVNGNVCSVIISARDITKSKILQLDIQKALDKEKELNQLRSRFISMVSHEYRTPLTSILSSVEILEMGDEKYSKEKKKVHFERIEKNIDYLISMIDEVLYVNRIESDRIPVSLNKTNLPDFCKEVFNEIKGLYPKIRSDIKISLEENIYNVDTAILKKILGNLLANAYKYNIENGKVSFIVNSELDKLIFKISDSGIGIPEGEQKNVFEPFTRMTNTQHVKGSGLGLSIVKKSVEQLNGSISFISKINEGTTFVVSLPIK